MTIAIFTIGDEICIGQIVNTNAAWMAEQCSLQGWRVVAHSVLGDDEAQIIAEFDRLLTLADVVLVTGGLGPTHDDRTKAALVRYLGDTLVLHEPTLAHLHELFRQRGREMTERNRQQALLPTLCQALQNDKGTAAGMWFEIPANIAAPNTFNVARHAGKILVSMPGVPFEMRHLMTDRVIPRLRERSLSDEVTLFSTLLTTNIAESTLADMIGDVENFLEGQELAFLPSASGVKLRLTVTAPNRSAGEAQMQRLEAYLREKAGKFIYGNNTDTLESIVGNLLKQRKKTIAVAESCTGGLLGAALTAMSGSSAYFLGGVQCYSNEAKMQFLKVHPDTILHKGAVSQETAEELARNVRTMFDADIGVSITGIAGPTGGTPDKPVGTVWIGLAFLSDGQTVHTEAHKFLFGNERTINRERSVAAVLNLLYQKLV